MHICAGRDDVKFFIPQPKLFHKKNLRDILNSSARFKNPFRVLMQARWLCAAEASGIQVIGPDDLANNSIENKIVIFSDHFIKDYEKVAFDQSGNINIPFGASANPTSTGNKMSSTNSFRMFGSYNFFESSRLQSYPDRSFSDYGSLSLGNYIFCPLGGLFIKELVELAKQKKPEHRLILLDDPHRLQYNNINQIDLHHVFSLHQALKICEVLIEKYDYAIHCQHRGHDEDRALESVIVKHGVKFFKENWKPYSTMVNQYSRYSLIFSHFQETHGFGVYESLQTGTPVAYFFENLNPLILKPILFGTPISLDYSADISARIINDFIVSENEDRRGARAELAHSFFSSETFGVRLLEKLKLNSISKGFLHHELGARQPIP